MLSAVLNENIDIYKYLNYKHSTFQLKIYDPSVAFDSKLSVICLYKCYKFTLFVFLIIQILLYFCWLYVIRSLSHGAMWTRKLKMEHLVMEGQRVLIRADFDVPVQDSVITNNKKIIQGLDSIVYAVVKGAKNVVIISHLGKPKGSKNLRFSLNPVAIELNKLLKDTYNDPIKHGKYNQAFKLYSASSSPSMVTFLPDCYGSEVEEACKNAPEGSIYLLENIRFYLEEEGFGMDASGNRIYSSVEATNKFRDYMVRLGDVYVNDTFSVAHRLDSSILGLGFKKRAAGLLLSKEIKYYHKLINKPDRPLLAILGGITVMDKFCILDYLLDKVSEIIIAGAMAFPFLSKLKRMPTGHSLFDAEGYKIAKSVMKKAKKKNVSIHFPVDFLTSSKLGAVRLETVKSGIENEWMGLDIGPESCSIFRRIIMRAKTIVWSGPVGAYELEDFRMGTECVLYDIVKATSRGATSILVGEDTAACAALWGQETNVSHVSSGGEAGKEILSGKVLPGIASLSGLNS